MEKINNKLINTTLMGSTCKSCNACYEQTFEVVLGGYFNEPYQNMKVQSKDLNKYDKFYRVVCDPFHQVNIKDYIE